MKLKRFDYQIKSNQKTKTILGVIIVIVLLVTGVLIYRSFAEYRVTQRTHDVLKGQVEAFTALSEITLNKLGNPPIKTGIPYGSNGNGVEGWYQAQDDYGDTYYYYGTTSRPLVSYKNKLWQVIRINGDGSLRIVTTLEADEEPNSVYNSITPPELETNVHLGYTSVTPNGIQNSVLKTKIDALNDIYNDSLLVSDTLFCNDCSLYETSYGNQEPDDTGLGTGTDLTYYGAFYRLRNETPSLKCPRQVDAYTHQNFMGNKTATTLLGVLTADEVYMTNYNAYLEATDTNVYWTMSPSQFKDDHAKGYVFSSAGLELKPVTEVAAIRLVLNLKADLNYTGTGTEADPFVANPPTN